MGKRGRILACLTFLLSLTGASSCHQGTDRATGDLILDAGVDAASIPDGELADLAAPDQRTAGDLQPAPDMEADIDECVPDCAGRMCGSDGCGGICGTCPIGPCVEPLGVCPGDEPQCNGKECGSDGLGGLCGVCPDGLLCSGGGQCVDPLISIGCDSVVACLNGCEPHDATCAQTCINSANVTAQMQINDLLKCLDASGYWACAERSPSCQEAARQSCVSEIEACFSESYRCGEVFYCSLDCPQENGVPECTIDCVGTASDDALALFGDLAQCLAGACSDWGDSVCRNEAISGVCNSQYAACMAP